MQELRVCDFVYEAALRQSATSNQLRWLRQAPLIKRRQEGHEVYGTLSDHHVVHILGMSLEHAKEC